MFFLLFLLPLLVTGQQLRCDFESPCVDFQLDNNWGRTHGPGADGIDHDHTWGNASGHYIFYAPISRPSVIRTQTWLTTNTEQSMCFSLWFFTPLFDMPFYVQLVQGDDEQLTRMVAIVPGKNGSDWSQLSVLLPPGEKFAILISANLSAVPLVFDDLSVDFCSGPAPDPPPRTLYTCDFEQSCADGIWSLPNYPYIWRRDQAGVAHSIDALAPAADYTYGDSIGHYLWLNNTEILQNGGVGYFHTQQYTFTSKQTFCLNFEYFMFSRDSYKSQLRVWTWTENDGLVRDLWPSMNNESYKYAMDKWTWATINLPVGTYTLLFRMDNSDDLTSSFAVDDLSIVSCSYPATFLNSNTSLLTFSCSFDDGTPCGLQNGGNISPLPPSYNFTVESPNTIPNRDLLGPSFDHTTNSSNGSFLYWATAVPYKPSSNGRIRTLVVQQNMGMCIRFAYYVKSTAQPQLNSTWLAVTTRGCYVGQLWSMGTDDSHGWQVVTIPVLTFACGETFYIDVAQQTPTAVAVALDDVQVDQCKAFDPTTTTTSISTISSTTITSPATTSTPITSSTTTTPTTTTSTPITSLTTITSPATTSTPITSSTTTTPTTTTSTPITSSTTTTPTTTTSTPITSLTTNTSTAITSTPVTSSTTITSTSVTSPTTSTLTTATETSSSSAQTSSSRSTTIATTTRPNEAYKPTSVNSMSLLLFCCLLHLNL